MPTDPFEQALGASAPVQGQASQAQAASADPFEAAIQSGEKQTAGAVTRFAKNFWEQANPVEGVKGLVHLASHPVQSYLQDAQIRTQVFEQAVKDYKEGNLVQAASRAMFSLAPFIGQVLNKGYTQIESGDIAGGAGTFAGIAAGGEIAGGLAKVAGKGLGAVAKGTYGGASAATGVAEALPKTAAGLEKVAQKIEALEQSITQGIKGKGVTINPDQIAASVSRSEGRYGPGQQFVPARPSAEVAAVKGEFLDRYVTPAKPGTPATTVQTGLLDAQGNPITRVQPGTPATPRQVQQIPAEDVQAMKVGTNKTIGEQYGSEARPRIEAQKDLVYGAKTALEQQFPWVKEVNDKIGSLIDWKKEVTPLVKKAADERYAQLSLTPGTAAAGVAGEVAGQFLGQPGKGVAAALFLKSVLQLPAVRSRLGIGLYKIGKVASASAGIAKVAEWAAQFGNFAEQATQEQPQQ